MRLRCEGTQLLGNCWIRGHIHASVAHGSFQLRLTAQHDVGATVDQDVGTFALDCPIGRDSSGNCCTSGCDDRHPV